MKKFFFLLALLSLAACKTCPANNEITEGIVTTLAGSFECGGYDAMKDSVLGLVKACDYCGKNFKAEELMKAIPDGTWTPKAMVCYSVVQKLKAAKSNPEWGCQKTIDWSVVEAACQKME
jgi:hypothetical protein